MRAWYSPNTPRPVAWLAFVEVLVRNFGVLRPMDNVVIVDASVTPAGTLSSSIHVFRGQNGGDWILTITIDDDDDNLVSRRGFEHQVVPFNPQDYMEIDPFHIENIPREAAARQMEREEEWSAELITLQGTVADLEKKCKENAKEIADLNDVVHSQEKELKGYNEEIQNVRDARDKAKKELTNLNIKLSRAENEVELAQSQVKLLEDALEEPKSKIRKQQSLLAAQHRDDDHRLDAELHSEHVEDDTVNVGQAAKELPWETIDSSEAITSHAQVDPDVFEDHASGEGDGRLSEGSSRLKQPRAGMTTRSSLPIATPSHSPQLAAPAVAPATILPLELMVPASELLSDHDIDNVFTVDMLKAAITAMGAKPLAGKSTRKAHLQQQAKDIAQEKRNLQA
ncbi:hypothetical protein PLEOSDRAFT_160698 [Pleurotus ostreatus PC15]|uniref:Uncharacterized protein n=1 Tax=Pleurotus ostreatus (strain PC15) TaxID=1137138 RepID=A0A067NGJ9_PLEO1|nr:hypothetical protein PLEOSDRAFT_160698 [Pleurotus ostreatus PC15]